MEDCHSIEINDKPISNMEHCSRFFDTGSDSGIEDPLQSEERDTIPHHLIRTTSPKHRILSAWDTRFPKRLCDIGMYTYGGRSRDRRMSDPGNLSVSPVRSRGRVRHGLSELSLEEESEEDIHDHHHPRLQGLRSTSLSVDDCYISPRSISPSRSRSRDRFLWKRKAQRSYSLPSSDPGVFEAGEALGALAISGDSLDFCGRRRSVSMEPSYLEAIAEEGANHRASLKINRRHSTSTY